ncbi:MAG TPA: site-2 protease family protein [Chryseolinea sp.]|nr:site-2 protease family protein [Chryseolinea sp.]
MNSDQRRVALQIVLLLLTLICTTIAGAEWTNGKSIYMKDYTWSDFFSGFHFSIPFLAILTVHELGHYFMAKYHKVKVTLPYYIPMPPFPFSIGTMGAVIRMGKVYSKKQNFDIGLAGPLAGFMAALVVLFYGFTHLPEPEYIFTIHPEYEQYGLGYADHVYDDLPTMTDVILGKNILFILFEKFVADPGRIPNPHELFHYPYLLAGFLSLVFTWLNLLPIGQLDGGHVVYGLFGFRIHKIIATIIFFALLLYAGIGAIDLSQDSKNLAGWIGGSFLFLYLSLGGLGLPRKDTLMYALLILAFMLIVSWMFPTVHGYSGWLVFIFILGGFIGIQHPPSEIEEPLDDKRIVLGWIALFIFVICFSPAPIEIQ